MGLILMMMAWRTMTRKKVLCQHQLLVEADLVKTVEPLTQHSVVQCDIPQNIDKYASKRPTDDEGLLSYRETQFPCLIS